MRVWPIREIVDNYIAGARMPQDFVSLREAAQEMRIARQVNDDGLPLHAPEFVEGHWQCWCHDPKCAWNMALMRSEMAATLRTITFLLDDIEHLQERTSGGDSDPDEATGAGQGPGNGPVPEVRGSDSDTGLPPPAQSEREG